MASPALSPAPSPRGEVPPSHSQAATPEQATTTRKSNSGESMQFPLTAVAASVSPLPQHVASRWARASSTAAERSQSVTSHESIDSKLLAAEAKRQAKQAFLQWVATRSVARSAARTTRRESREGGLDASLEGTNLQSKLDEEAASMGKGAPPPTGEKEKKAPPHHRLDLRRDGGETTEEERDHRRALDALRAAAAHRRLRRAWESFRGARSSELAAAFVSTGVLGKDDGVDGAQGRPSSPPPPAPVVLGVGGSGGSPPPLSHRASADGVAASDFDDLASALTSPETLDATRALLSRIEARLALRPTELAHTGVEACHGKLVASFSARRRGAPTPSTPSPGRPPSRRSDDDRRLPSLPGGRYPLRVFLSSLMMVAHPDVVFRRASGDKERALRDAAGELRRALCELLASMIVGGGAGPPSTTRRLPPALARALPPSPRVPPLSSALAAFDAGWAEFLSRFVSWKAADAAALEADLVRAAVELEGSRLAVEAGTSAAGSSPSQDLSPESRPRPRRAASLADAAEVSLGVSRDLDLLRAKARELGGAGAERRLEAALEGARARARAAAEAVEAATAAAAEATASPAPPPPAAALPSAAPTAASSPILNLPSISRPPPGTLPGPSKTEHVLWGLIKSGGEPAGMLRVAEAIWTDAASSGSSLPTLESVERAASEAEREAERASRAASAEVAASGVDSPSSSATDAAVAAARASEEARWARATLAFCKQESSSGATALVAASALSTSARRVAGALGTGARASDAAHSLRREYDTMSLRDEFSTSASQGVIPGLDVERVLSRLEGLSGTIKTLCAPARDAGHEAAASASRAAVGAALAAVADATAEGSPASFASARVALATALASSLRKADAGARLLQADVAAAEARALASSSAAAAAAGDGSDPLSARARSLLRLRASLPAGADEGELSERLPLTRAWLADACGRLPVVEGGLPPVASDDGGDGDLPPPPAASLPANLRSGLASSSAASRGSSFGGRAEARPRHELVLPVPFGGWRAAFRAGLLSLVAAPTPLAATAAAAAAAAAESGPGVPSPLAVPEVVALEFAELRAAQHEFQVLAVCAAGVMLVGGARANAPPSSAAALPSPADVRARLRALLADSATSATLPDLAAELALLASPSSSSPSAAPSADLDALEREMGAGLGRLLRRGSAPFEALSGALEAALAARLLRGKSKGADAASAAALARAGATVLARDVDALAERISRVAAVTESVFGPLLEHVAEGLL